MRSVGVSRAEPAALIPFDRNVSPTAYEEWFQRRVDVLPTSRTIEQAWPAEFRTSKLVTNYLGCLLLDALRTSTAATTARCRHFGEPAGLLKGTNPRAPRLSAILFLYIGDYNAFHHVRGRFDE